MQAPVCAATAGQGKPDFLEFLRISGDGRKCISCTCKALASGGLQSFGGGLGAFFDQQFGRLVKALAALRAAAERFVNGIGIARATARRFAQFAVTDGIADANIHRRLPVAPTR